MKIWKRLLMAVCLCAIWSFTALAAESDPATIANSRRKYWYISNNKAVIWALNKERLINSGYYDLATAYQSVHVNY